MALRSSRTSFSSSLIRCASSVVVPGRVPWSIWAFLTQVRRASGWTPSSSPILRIAPLARAGSASASNAILVARSRSSSGYFFCPMTVIPPCHHCPHQTRGDSNRHDSPLLAPTLECLGRFGFDLPEHITVHLDAGYDSRKTRELLEVLGCHARISPRGTPLQAGRRWVIERTNSWHTRGFRRLQVCGVRGVSRTGGVFFP